MSEPQETNGQEPQVTTEPAAAVDQSTAVTASAEQVATPEVGDQQSETFDREYVEKLRSENAAARIKAKEHADAVTAAKADSDALVQQIGKAFGFIKDEDTEQADANKIVEQLTSERDSLQTRLRNQSEKIALTDAAKAHGADLDILLPYLKGKGLLADLDPNADDYADQVSQVVQAEVTSTPKLAAQAAERRSGVDPTNTNTEQSGAPITIGDLEKMTSEEIVAADKAGKLAHLYK
ncbi:hypothetical protein [Corynebacterium sp. A21]|uniref:hypothetical protein n=1 Tax=Corynebacterium sp. A21 TaxID=3457318 RepID=UPI003FD029C1